MYGLSEVLGNEQIKEYFSKVLADGQVSHAYILTGEPGMGRKTLTNAFAMTLLCEKGGPEPCGVCHSCVQFLSGNHPDVIYVTHEKESVGVEDIRDQLVGTAAIRPYSGAYKVYILEDAEKMTVQAQNALLKTLEEPPDYVVIFLLATRTDAFLPTILSRCITLTLKPLYDDVIRSYLTDKLHVEKSRADICTSFARGSLGKAITLAESEEFGQMREQILGLLRNLQTMDIVRLVDILKQWKNSRQDIDACLDFLQMWYRDVLMFKATQDTAGFIFKDEYRTIRAMADRTSFSGIENILEAIDTARVRLNANVDFGLTMELMLLRMKENGE